MNKHFPLILAFCTLCISSSVHATGKLLSYQLVKSYTTAELAEFWRKNHVPKMIISAKDSVDVYEITYETQFMECNPQPVIASGLFFLPHHKRTNLPLLCYDHGTEIRREREITMNGEQTLCLGFATDGYAVAFPDYVGLGIGEKDQLYLNAESEARSSVDMLRAVRDLSIILSYNLNDKLFITGYSQGGHAAMATHKLIQEKFGDEFQVTASSPMSGPYDVYFTVDNGKDREYTYPGFLMMLVKSYYDTKKPGVNMKEALKAPYDSIIPPLLDGCSSLSQLDQYLPSIPYKALTDEFPKLTMFGETWVHGVPNQSYFAENNYNIPFKSNLQATTDFQTLWGITDALTKDFGWTEGVNRLYTTLAQDFVYKDPTRQVIFLDNHDMARFYSVVNENMDKYKCGLAWLLTCRGIPQMYYGDELVTPGTTSPNDGHVRLDFPGGWEGDSKNAFTGAGMNSDELAVQSLVKTLGNYRKKSSALQTGKLMQYLPDDGLYVYFRYDANSTVMCVMNCSDNAKQIDFSKYAERTAGFAKAESIVDAASFNTVMLSISCGDSTANAFSTCIPSTTYNGEPLWVIELRPRMLMSTSAPGAPSETFTLTPASRPARASAAELLGLSFNSFAVIEDTDAVRSLRLTVA